MLYAAWNQFYCGGQNMEYDTNGGENCASNLFLSLICYLKYVTDLQMQKLTNTISTITQKKKQKNNTAPSS